MLYKGYRRGIQKEDIYEIVKDIKSERLANSLEEEWKKCRKKNKTMFLYSIFRIIWKQYTILGVTLAIVESTHVILNPILIGKITSYFTPGQTEVSFRDAWYYALGLAVSTLVYDCYMNNYFLFLGEISLKIRAACCALIYRKCLRLNETSVAKCANGIAVTIITKDLLVFNDILDPGLVTINGIFQATILVYVMYTNVGVAGLVGFVVLFLAFPLQVFLAYRISKNRLRTAKKTDERVSITQEILTAMRIIKMYTWEKFFSRSVKTLRSKELHHLRVLFYLKAFVVSIGQLGTRLAFYVCVIVYVALGNHITAEKAFVVIGCFTALRQVLHVFMPTGISQMAELNASLQRITDFLQLREVPENPNIDSNVIQDKIPSIFIENAVVKSDEGVNVLENITLDVNKGLAVLTGSIGSGKSVLFKLMLSDVEESAGVVEIAGKMSYASQEPWLFPGTVRQNIIFAEMFDKKRYEAIVRVCALRKDFEAFPQGDDTCLADKGLNLSRGQKTRINLARAIYKEADIYLLDDCLSAVDSYVGKHIFYECIKGILKNKICILVTHNEQFLQAADTIVVLDRGSITFKGNYTDLKKKNNKALMSNIRSYEESEGSYDKKEEKVTNNLDDVDESTKLLMNQVATKKDIYEESKEEGSVKNEVYWKYFTSGGGIKMLILLIVLSIVAQATASWSDYFVSFWVDMEQAMSGFRYNQTTNSTEYLKLQESYSSVMKQYSFVILATIIFTLVKAFAFFTFSTIASKNIHNQILDKILYAPMIFFDTNLSGNILNRFSRDLGILDEHLPHTVNDIVRIILTLLATFMVVSSVNLFFLIPSGIFLILLVLARYLYIPTGRSIRRLEGATRSPIIGHLNATLEGLTTVRASHAQNILKKEFDRHQDLYNSASHMHLATKTAFAFYLDSLSSFYITVITLAFLFFKTDTLAGQVGLAITQSFSLTGLLQFGVRYWAELENQMTSTERVLEYSKVVQEKRTGNILNHWPNNGKIVYTDVNLQYDSESEMVLKNISFEVKPKQKIGVVGRTGAGKSSIISTLFRMYEYMGAISIDDVDVNNVAVELLRSKISIIPQDPVLFSGTVRSNLDPNNEYSDKVLWDALEEVEMKKLVASLNRNISEGDTNFSIGQSQLLCLARAIIQNNSILILDEATANVDPHTDSLIQRTIKNRFTDCTVITIAHRLHTIMDSDNVLVMDSGVAVEYDNPKVLVEKQGLFYNMVKEAGLL